jgi:hypothetical protein
MFLSGCGTDVSGSFSASSGQTTRSSGQVVLRSAAFHRTDSRADSSASGCPDSSIYLVAQTFGIVADRTLFDDSVCFGGTFGGAYSDNYFCREFLSSASLENTGILSSA